ncbi:MAG: hypothetical protein AB7V45_16955 [Candidatus Krumholzibacteriia bacterium]
MTDASKSSRPAVGLILLAVLLVLICLAALYRPDRPVATIEPGSSSGPAFVAQIIRPRLGLPLGGILPPGIFGFEGHLGFDSASPGAAVGRIEPGRLELRSDGWDVTIVLNGRGRVSPGTEAVFELLFENTIRKVRCRTADPAVGTFTMDPLSGDSGEVSGSFDIELPRCEDADTGTPLGWPPKPFVLHGSFDRLPSTHP